jgi:hypothetical protein
MYPVCEESGALVTQLSEPPILGLSLYINSILAVIYLTKLQNLINRPVIFIYK